MGDPAAARRRTQKHETQGATGTLQKRKWQEKNKPQREVVAAVFLNPQALEQLQKCLLDQMVLVHPKRPIYQVLV
ncbi:hypothetical protein GOP47_0031044, partial [Adiantum capillus-veneris]